MPHPGCGVKISRSTDMTEEVEGRKSFHVGVEPGQGALDYVAAVFGVCEHVALVFVDYELGFDA